MKSIKVKEVMCHEPFMIRPQQTVSEAAKLMRGADCGFLPVGESDKVSGIITDRDITLRVVAEGKDPAKTSVRDIMTKDPRTCDEECGLEEAAEMMRRYGVSRLLVSKNGKVTGVVTLKRLLKNKGNLRASIRVLHEWFTPVTTGEPKISPEKQRRKHG